MSTGAADCRVTVRVLCLDAYQRLLLLRWRDTQQGRHFLTLPGAQLDHEAVTPSAVGRVLYAATGLPAGLVTGCAATSGGQPYDPQRPEADHTAFFLARIGLPHELVPLALTAATGLVEGRWMDWHELLAAEEPVQPRMLADVLAALDATGPWNPDQPWAGPATRFHR